MYCSFQKEQLCCVTPFTCPACTPQTVAVSVDGNRKLYRFQRSGRWVWYLIKIHFNYNSNGLRNLHYCFFSSSDEAAFFDGLFLAKDREVACFVDLIHSAVKNVRFYHTQVLSLYKVLDFIVIEFICWWIVFTDSREGHMWCLTVDSRKGDFQEGQQAGWGRCWGGCVSPRIFAERPQHVQGGDICIPTVSTERATCHRKHQVLCNGRCLQILALPRKGGWCCVISPGAPWYEALPQHHACESPCHKVWGMYLLTFCYITL